MLKLTYTRKSDLYQTVTVLGDEYGIRDLYWQLTQNYKAVDGTEIGYIKVTNLDGDVIAEIMATPHDYSTRLSTLGG